MGLSYDRLVSPWPWTYHYVCNYYRHRPLMSVLIICLNRWNSDLESKNIEISDCAGGNWIPGGAISLQYDWKCSSPSRRRKKTKSLHSVLAERPWSPGWWSGVRNALIWQSFFLPPWICFSWNCHLCSSVGRLIWNLSVSSPVRLFSGMSPEGMICPNERSYIARGWRAASSWSFLDVRP